MNHMVIKYRKTSNISHTLVGNKIVDNSDVVGVSPVSAAPTTSSFSTPGFNGLSKDNCNRIQETFKLWDLVQLILEVLQYMLECWIYWPRLLPFHPHNFSDNGQKYSMSYDSGHCQCFCKTDINVYVKFEINFYLQCHTRLYRWISARKT